MSIVQLVKKGIVLWAAVAVICALFGPALVAGAAGEVGVYIKQPVSASMCSLAGFDVSFPLYQNVPDDGRTWEAILTTSATDGTNSGSHTEIWSSHLSPTAGEEFIFTGSYVAVPSPTSPGALTMPFTETVIFTTLADGVTVNESKLVMNCDAGGNAGIGSLTNTSSGGGKPSAESTVPIPGPDMVLIPDDAVMGTFTADTALHFQPDASAVTPYTMDVGQSLWVFGLDSSGAFYQVLLSGKTYWVPVSSIGPTYSPPWNGTSLPSGMVQ